MKKREKSDNQKDIQQRDSRVAVFFTRISNVLFLLIVTAIFTASFWQIRQLYLRLRSTEIQISKLNEFELDALYLDEALTMSANMAAATHNSQWVSRHDKLSSRIETALTKIHLVFHKGSVDAVNAKAALPGFVDDKLDKMERRALAMVSEGKHKKAAALLQSSEYQKQRQAYSEGLSEFVENARGVLEDRRARNARMTYGVLAATGVALVVIAVIWLLVDTKIRHRRERAAMERRIEIFSKEWQKTFNAISDGVCIVDKKNRKILQCNMAMTRFLKQPHKQIIGKKCCELLHGSPEPAKRCPLERMRKTGRSETTDFQIGGKWLRIKVDPMKNSKGQVVGAVHITSDITEQRNAERAVKESENKFRLAFANAQDAIIWIDVQSGTITNCNKATEDLFGRKIKEIIGHHHTTLSPVGRAEHFHSLLDGSDKDLNGSVETQILTKDGQTRTVTISVSAMTVEGKEVVQAIIRDITENKRANEEIKNLARFPSEDPNPVLRISEDGRILYANDASSSVLSTWRVREGETVPELWCRRIAEIAGTTGSASYEMDCDEGHTFFMTLQPIVGTGYVNVYGLDITKRKKAEKEKTNLELQLSQQQKMEAIGTLAGGIAHDFNNILAAMQGYLELSLDDLSDEAAVGDHLEKMKSCVDRATKLVRQILTFSRKNQQEQEKEPVRICTIVEEVHGMMRSSLPATINFDIKIHSDAGIVLADPTQIHQVLVNLCTNASHAMRDAGGQLEGAGSYVKISVSDTGCGMEKEVLERIFEPFFTTRKVNEGTGLGLSVVHGIIKSHGGAMTVNSTPGEGTTFDIFLPRIDSDQITDTEQFEPTFEDDEVILLVDDEEVMVDVTKKILERLGFEVVTTTSSVDALKTFQADPKKFDLVITDQVMPNMTGTQLAEKLVALRPDIPIILCSGFPENVNTDHLGDIGIKEFILKPVSREQIARIIRKVLYKKAVMT